MKRRQGIAEKISQKASNPVAQALTVLAAAGGLLYVFFNEVLDITIIDDINSFAAMDFIPEASEGECLYVSPDQEMHVTYSARDTNILVGIYRTVAPPWDDNISWGREEHVGTLPLFKIKQCATLAAEHVAIVQTFDDAAAMIAPQVLHIAEKLDMLDNKLEWNRDVNWEITPKGP